jgi:hypothetical protein
VARVLRTAGILSGADAAALAAAWEASLEPRLQEASLLAAFDVARMARASSTVDGIVVGEVIRAERAERAALQAELDAAGPSAAAAVERQAVLTRLDELAAKARRDPLGIGVVAGYVAAVDAQAIRLRAALAAAAGGWSRERAGVWLGSRAA